MIRICRFVTALAVIGLALPADALAQGPITQAEALKDPVEVLAARAIGPFGARYVEMTRPVMRLEPDEGVWFLTFATRPQAMTEHGLCEAGVLEIDFRNPGWAMPPQPFETRKVYRVIADTAPDSNWGWPGLKDPDPCRTAGPVIWSGRREDEGKPIFFPVSGDETWVWHGVRGVQLALAAIRASPEATPCGMVQEEGFDCAALRRFAAKATTDDLRALDVDVCEAKPERWCVRAWLRLPERSLGDDTLILSFDFALSQPHTDAADLQGLTISKPGVIYD